MVVIGIGGRKKGISYSFTSDMRKCDVSKTLNQSLRGNPTYELRLVLQSPPVFAGDRQWLGYNFFSDFFFPSLTYVTDSAGKKLWRKRKYWSRRKQSWYLPGCHCAVDTLERGSWKEVIYQSW